MDLITKAFSHHIERFGDYVLLKIDHFQSDQIIITTYNIKGSTNKPMKLQWTYREAMHIIVRYYPTELKAISNNIQEYMNTYKGYTPSSEWSNQKVEAVKSALNTYFEGII